ncbi:MAG: hypothetical protein ACJ72H_28625 [Candidatus Sulfotelmatobacter sp.]
MKRSLRNTSRQTPLTPMPPEPSSPPTGEHAAVVPDQRAERILFQLYLEQKQLAEHWQVKFQFVKDKLRAEQNRFTKYRAKGLARGIAKQFRPNRNPEVK